MYVELSWLARNPVGGEKGTKAVISLNFNVYGERTFNSLRANFAAGISRTKFSNSHSRLHSKSSALLTALERLRVAHHEQHGLCQTLQNREIALVKSKGLRRKNL